MGAINHKTSRLRRSSFVKYSAAGAAALLLAGTSCYLSNRLLYIARKADEAVTNREIQAGRLNADHYRCLPKKDVWVTAADGTRLKSVFITPYPGHAYIVFCHGVTEHKISSIKYMNLFLKRGFNAVLWDHRRHGESEGTFTSYGHFEKQDLKAVIDELIRREGPQVSFGVHGESMGAATLLLYAGTVEDRANFYIADCPFSDFRQQVRRQIKREVGASPLFLLWLAEWSVWLRGRFKLKDISPLQAVQHIQKPVLFIHSQEDTYILPDMTETLFQAKRGPKQLFMAQHGAHAQSYNVNPEQYEQAIDRFLAEYNLLPK